MGFSRECCIIGQRFFISFLTNKNLGCAIPSFSAAMMQLVVSIPSGRRKQVSVHFKLEKLIS